jgi:hypothetical protein
MSMRKRWMDAAIEAALKRTRGMDEVEQNEFWLEHNFVFKEYSSLQCIMDFVGGNCTNQQVECYTCHACDSIRIVQEEETADVICEDCGIVQSYPASFLNGRISEGYQYTNRKCYTRADHLKSILIELQCGRSREIQELAEDVEAHLKEKKKQINFKNVRGCLRKLGYYQHYLHIPSILHYLLPQQYKPWKPGHGSVDRLLALFHQYQEHFENYLLEHAIKRRNSLNYHFILQKLFVLIEDHDIPSRFLHGPKGKKSILEHETIWSVVEPKLIQYKKC